MKLEDCVRIDHGFEIPERPEVCAEHFNLPLQEEEPCYGTSPTANFCVSCPAAMADRCLECTPGFLLDRAGVCRNPREQVTFTMTTKDNLTSEWQTRWRPKLDKCAKTLVKGSAGDFAVKAYAVVPNMKGHGADIHVAVAVSQGQVASEVGARLRLNYDLSSSFAVRRGICPEMFADEFAVRVVPVDAKAPVIKPGFGTASRQTMSLQFFLGVSASMLVAGVVVFLVMERKHRAREVTFLTDSLHGSSVAPSCAQSCVDIEIARK